MRGRSLSGLQIPFLSDDSRKHIVLDCSVDTGTARHRIRAMVDSGATGNFIDKGLASQLGIPLLLKDVPEAVQAVDGSPLSSGPVNKHTMPLLLRHVAGGSTHTENIQFNVIDAPQYGFILGLPWLTLHNPEIHWGNRTLLFTSEYCKDHCHTDNPHIPEFHSIGYTIATAAEKEVQLPSVYSGFSDVFDKAQAEVLPPHRSYDCRIDLIPGAVLPSCRVYALSVKETEYLKEYIDTHVQRGWIRTSRSPAASPLFFVPKANGELRPCVDYRGLNKNTIRNRYPLPLIPVLLDQVKTAKIYTRLDLRGAYHLVRMREGDEWKTAFKTQDRKSVVRERV